MRKIDQLFAEYAESHQNATNKFIHWICVPLIFWSILGFISIIPAPHFCLQYFGCMSIISITSVILITIFYLRLSWRIAFVMLFVMIIMEYFVYTINIRLENYSWIFYLSIFIITWILQFLGHKIEGKKPSFIKDIQFLLIGPIWLLHFVLKKLNLRY